jgi:hypothetical protein
MQKHYSWFGVCADAWKEAGLFLDFVTTARYCGTNPFEK